MPPLPPKPKVAPVVPQALVVAALATGGCATSSHPVRIGMQLGPPGPVRIGEQPGPPEPPVRIGAEACVEAQVVDAQGAPLAGVLVNLHNGTTLASDANGIVAVPRHGLTATISLPGYTAQLVTLDCDGMTIVLERNGEPLPGPGDPVRPPPPRIGMAPDPVELEQPPPRIGKAPPPG